MPSVDASPLRVAYILKKYPRLSETFILNEILGLEETGVDVSIHSLTPADEGRFHADVARVAARARYLPQFKSSGFTEALRALAAVKINDHRMERLLAFLELLPREKRHIVAYHSILLADFIRASGIDHVHAHFMTVAAHCAHAAHLVSGVPFTVTAHAKDIYRDTVDATLFAEVAGAAEALVTVSEANRDFIVDRFDVNHEKVVKIHNGLPLDDRGFSDAPAERDRALILGVGRLVEKKGFDDLVRACRDLVDQGRDIRCLIVGDGDCRKRLEALIEELKLESVVELTGPRPRDEVLRLMRRARVLAAPFRIGADGNRDALPTVLVEALALGLPVVATDINGVSEIVTDGEQGLVVPPEDPARLRRSLDAVMTDDSLWARLSGAGPDRARRRFDRAATLPGLVEIFERSRARVAGGVTP